MGEAPPAFPPAPRTGLPRSPPGQAPAPPPLGAGPGSAGSLHPHADETAALAHLTALAATFPDGEEVGRMAGLAAAFPDADVEGAVSGAAGRGAQETQAALAVAGANPAFVVGVVPNPVAGQATLGMELASAVLYDATGRVVAVPFDGALTAGAHALAFDASRLAPGVYVAHVVASGEGAPRVAVRRFVVAR